jgi:hypothetical protein
MTRFDWTAIGNLWRVPIALTSAMVILPVVGIRFRCPKCDCRFIASDDGTTPTAIL